MNNKKICPNCGQELEEKYKFCYECGTQIPEIEQPKKRGRKKKVVEPVIEEIIEKKEILEPTLTKEEQLEDELIIKERAKAIEKFGYKVSEIKKEEEKK